MQFLCVDTGWRYNISLNESVRIKDRRSHHWERRNAPTEEPALEILIRRKGFYAFMR